MNAKFGTSKTTYLLSCLQSSLSNVNNIRYILFCVWLHLHALGSDVTHLL